MVLLIVEVLLTVIAAAMFLWRGFLDMKEGDQLILDDAEAHFAREQAIIRDRVNTLTRYIKGVGLAWGLLAVVIFGIWVAEGLALI
jgi:hypothetical protein